MRQQPTTTDVMNAAEADNFIVRYERWRARNERWQTGQATGIADYVTTCKIPLSVFRAGLRLLCSYVLKDYAAGANSAGQVVDVYMPGHDLPVRKTMYLHYAGEGFNLTASRYLAELQHLNEPETATQPGLF